MPSSELEAKIQMNKTCVFVGVCALTSSKLTNCQKKKKGIKSSKLNNKCVKVSLQQTTKEYDY